MKNLGEKKLYERKNDFSIVSRANCMTEGGKPTGNDLQEQLSNRSELYM